MTVQELEDKVWSLDGIRIVVRDASNATVKDYTYKRAARAGWSITKFKTERIARLLKGQQVVILKGDGLKPHGRTLLSSIRRSYKKR